MKLWPDVEYTGRYKRDTNDDAGDAKQAAGRHKHYEPAVHTASGVRFKYWTWEKEGK